MKFRVDWRNENERLQLVQLMRVVLLTIVLSIGAISSIAHVGFANWSVLGPFYGVLFFAFLQQLILFSAPLRFQRKRGIQLISFSLDAFVYSMLIYYSGLGQSLFLFLFLVNILLAGMAAQGFGALGVAMMTSIFFSGAAVFSPEMKALNFFLLLALNNIAFFSVAGLAGYLSEQLQSLGTELVKTDLSLRSSQEINEVLIRNIPSGMLSFKEDGRLISFNQKAQEIIGRVSAESFSMQQLFLGQMPQESYFRGDLKFVKEAEALKVLGVTASKVFSSEFEESIWIVLFEDLTKLRQLEYAARQNEKLAAIGGLAAGIAHEIRNPLAGISGSIELLSQTTHNDDEKKLMRIVLREIDRLNNLITEFLDFAKPETPPVDVVNVSTVLNEVLDSIRSNTQVTAQIEQIREYSSELNILGRKDKLKQVFLNIVLNSYQAMNEKGQGQLSIHSQVFEDQIELRIRDTGCGMSEATRVRMFEPFHTTKPKGTGLGLAVTHKILEGHRAKIFVASQVGVGTEFVLTFPRAS